MQVVWPQGPEPIIQPWVAETHDIDWPWNPAGIVDGGEAFIEGSPNAAEPEPATVSRMARHIEVAKSLAGLRT